MTFVTVVKFAVVSCESFCFCCGYYCYGLFRCFLILLLLLLLRNTGIIVVGNISATNIVIAVA